jgi:uracil-DNA glycosylase
MPTRTELAPVDELEALLARIRACRICRDTPKGRPLTHEPRPVLRVSRSARICICGQAPGTRVHASGKPFTDPSGDRLRDWMGVTPDEFYDDRRVSIIPMGFCFPGLDDKGGDRPPRRECAESWRESLFRHLPQFELVLLVGLYAQRWHLGERAKSGLTANVGRWRDFVSKDGPVFVPLPHPSWRNNAWLKRNPWFGEEVLPYVRAKVRSILESGRES